MSTTQDTFDATVFAPIVVVKTYVFQNDLWNGNLRRRATPVLDSHPRDNNGCTAVKCWRLKFAYLAFRYKICMDIHPHTPSRTSSSSYNNGCIRIGSELSSAHSKPRIKIELLRVPRLPLVSIFAGQQTTVLTTVERDIHAQDGKLGFRGHRHAPAPPRMHQDRLLRIAALREPALHQV